jgi:membrane protein involved in colicin uptake
MTPEEIAAAEAAKAAEEEAKKAAEKKFTQAEIDAIVKERLTREEKKREEAAAKARAEAEAEAAKKNGEYQKLAEQREKELSEAQTRLKNFETLQAENTEMVKAMQAVIDQQTATLPEAVKELLKGLSPVKQLEWIAKNAGSFTSSTSTTQASKGAGALPEIDPGKPLTGDELIDAKARKYGPMI